MPRRNARDPHQVFEPLDLTPEEVRRSFPPPAHQNTRRARDDREREARDRQAAARINHGIDWTVCLVPGCGEELIFWGIPAHDQKEDRDHTIALPLCTTHLAVVVQQSGWRANDSLMIKTSTLLAEHKEARRKEQATTFRREWLERTAGDIYFVRLNGLIKVGWSRDVADRLRAYGPDVEVLCIYPGSRDDETHLHRQLRPVLARGREWYDDCPIIADYVTRAIAEHGPPKNHDGWTRPKHIIRPRKRSN